MDDSPLLIHGMSLIWRNTFPIHAGLNYPGDFLQDSLTLFETLPITRCHSRQHSGEQSDLLRTVARASRGAAGLGDPDLLRVQFDNLRMTPLEPLQAKYRRAARHITPHQIEDAVLEAEESRSWIRITPMLTVHRARIAIMAWYADISSTAGLDPDDAIRQVRLGLADQIMRLPRAWFGLLPGDAETARIAHLFESTPGWPIAVAGLRDLTRLTIQKPMMTQTEAHIRAAGITIHKLPERVGGHKHSDDETIPHATNSTSVILREYSPMAEANSDFVERWAAPLRGIGAMDTLYRERARWIVDRELKDNLSTDAEMALYLLGNSELLLYNARAPQIIDTLQARLRLGNKTIAAMYIAAHYTVLLEWVYIQEALLRAYIAQLDTLAASKHPAREDMIEVLHGALADLIAYQEHITPFANRIEFLDRAGGFHKLSELVKRFESKQALLFNYYSEYHDYRDARASEILNLVVGGLAAFELAALLVGGFNLSLVESPLPFIAVSLGSITTVVLILLLIMQRSRRG